MSTNPSSPGSMEEALAKESFYTAVLDAVRAVPSADVLWQSRGYGVLGSYATETRNLLHSILGEKAYNENIGANTKELTPAIVSKVIDHMVETNASVHALIDKQLGKNEDPEISIGRTRTKLSTLVKDPSSKDAKFLAWFFDNVADKPDKLHAFHFVNSQAEASRLSALLKARELFDSLSADESNLDIGVTGAATPDPNMQIGALENQKNLLASKEARAEAQMAAALAAKPDANVSHFGTQIDRAAEQQQKITAEIAALGKKRTALKSKLDEFQRTMSTALGVPFMMNTTARAAQFSKAAFVGDIAANPVSPSFAGTSFAVEEYFTEDEARHHVDNLSAALARGGTRAPTSKDVLDRLMRNQYSEILAKMTPQQQVEFLQQRRAAISSFVKESEKDDPKKEEKKEKKGKDDDHDKGGHGKKSWLGSAWKSFSDYMMDDSKDLLGFDVKSKDSGH